MAKAETGTIVPFPEKFTPYTEHPIDRLRPVAMHHVIGPFGHIAVVRTVDSVRDAFLSKTKDRKKHLHEFLSSAQDMNPANLALSWLSSTLENVIRGETVIKGKDIIRGESIPVYPTWSTFTNRQRIAAHRFTFAFKSIDLTDPTEVSVNAADTMFFTSGVSTVRDAIQMFASRHTDLTLNDFEQMTAFLRDPLTPSRLRGLATGGFGFLNSLNPETVNTTPQGMPWHDNPQKPVLNTSDDPPLAGMVTKELTDAAHEHRERVQTISPDDRNTLDEFSIFHDGVIHSIGCPVRFLTFRTDNQQLVANRLQLSQEQIADMLRGDQPIAKKTANDPNGYSIMRDAYETVGTLFADALEVATL